MRPGVSSHPRLTDAAERFFEVEAVFQQKMALDHPRPPSYWAPFHRERRAIERQRLCEEEEATRREQVASRTARVLKEVQDRDRREAAHQRYLAKKPRPKHVFPDRPPSDPVKHPRFADPTPPRPARGSADRYGKHGSYAQSYEYWKPYKMPGEYGTTDPVVWKPGERERREWQYRYEMGFSDAFDSLPRHVKDAIDLAYANEEADQYGDDLYDGMWDLRQMKAKAARRRKALDEEKQPA